MLEPVSKRLWLIGGVDAYGDYIADILKMQMRSSPAKLKLQCISQGCNSIDILKTVIARALTIALSCAFLNAFLTPAP